MNGVDSSSSAFAAYKQVNKTQKMKNKKSGNNFKKGSHHRNLNTNKNHNNNKHKNQRYSSESLSDDGQITSALSKKPKLKSSKNRPNSNNIQPAPNKNLDSKQKSSAQNSKISVTAKLKSKNINLCATKAKSKKINNNNNVKKSVKGAKNRKQELVQHFESTENSFVTVEENSIYSGENSFNIDEFISGENIITDVFENVEDNEDDVGETFTVGHKRKIPYEIVEKPKRIKKIVNVKDLSVDLSDISNMNNSLKSVESNSNNKVENRSVTKKKGLSVHKKKKKQVEIFDNSVETGRLLFSWLINPVDVNTFFQNNWEKQPIIIKRSCPTYYSKILSCEEIDRVLRNKQLFFSKNIDITSYSFASGRETHNPGGRASAPRVWDYYSNGCSVRILNPQTFFPKVRAINATLQEYFGCFVGSNVYLTPAGTQGFAPHYDDIEAFVVQIEGEKLWKLYAPLNPEEVLPRFSSGNFKEEDLGPPISEVLLQPGDIMYFPRGIIHQGSAQEHIHSLHITFSIYQKTSWADLLETLLPAALKSAIEEDVSFREGLPLHYLSHLGVVNSDKETTQREEFMKKLQTLISSLVNYAPVDAAVDQLGKKFIHDSLPPHLLPWEKERTVFGDGESIEKGRVIYQAEMSPDTRIKLLRFNCLRVVQEEEATRIYYSVNNSLEYHAEEPQFLEIDEDLAPAVDALISAYPDFVTVEDLPVDDEIAKVQIASDLWEHGLIITEDPIGFSYQ